MNFRKLLYPGFFPYPQASHKKLGPTFPLHNRPRNPEQEPQPEESCVFFFVWGCWEAFGAGNAPLALNSICLLPKKGWQIICQPKNTLVATQGLQLLFFFGPSRWRSSVLGITTINNCLKMRGKRDERWSYLSFQAAKQRTESHGFQIQSHTDGNRENQHGKPTCRWPEWTFLVGFGWENVGGK